MLTVLTPAGQLPVSADDFRAHCRGPEDGSDDGLLAIYLRAAVAFVEARTTLILQPTELMYRTAGWPCGDLQLPVAPVRDITKIEYLDAAGVLQEVAAPNWTWVRLPEGADITFASAYEMPELIEDQRQRVRVTFVAGYDDPNATGSGDDPDYALPPQVVPLLMMIGGHWYENREAVTKDGGQTLPFAAGVLLEQLRIFR